MGLFSILERSMTPLLFSYSCYQVSVCKETPLTVLPRWCSGKGLACQCRRRGFNPWVQKVPWSRKWQPAPVFLPGKSHGQRSLAAAVHEITKSQTQLERTHTHTHTHTHTNIPQVFFLSLLLLPKSDPLGLLHQPPIQCILYPTTSMILKKKKSLPRLSPTTILYLFFFILFFKIFFFHTWATFKVFIEFVAVFFLFHVLVFWLRGMWHLSSSPDQGLNLHSLHWKTKS